MNTVLTGNTHVDGIAKIHFQGNITPASWYQHIRYANGRGTYTDHLAIALLSDIVYWYRPSEVRDEVSGVAKGWSQKFQGDAFNRTYERYAVLMGCTMTQVVKSMRLLQDLGLIRIELRKIKLSDGKVANNVTHFIPVPEAIAKITYTISPEALNKKIKKNYHSASYKQSKPTPTDEFDCSPPTDEMMCTPTDEFDCTNTDTLIYGDYQEQEHECEQGQPLRSRSDGFDRAHSDEDFLEKCFSQGGVRSDRGFLDTPVSGETAVDQHHQSVAKNVALPTPPCSATPPSPQAVRIPKRKRKGPFTFRVNDDGWLRLPGGNRYAFVRWLAVRRMDYQMATAFRNVNLANNEQGKAIVKDNQIAFKYDEDIHFENELFSEGGLFPIAELRNELFEKDMLSQEAFNSFLEYVFLDSQRWYEEHGALGRKLLKKQSPAFTFFNNDRAKFDQLREYHRAN